MHQLSNTNCLFCGQSSILDGSLPSNLYHGTTFKYMKCQHCALVFIDPRPSAEILGLMYASGYQDELELSPFDIRKPMPGLRFSYHLQFNIIREHLGHGKLVDFGCGNGHFVYNAAMHGLQFDGVEFDDQVLAKLKKLMPEKDFQKVDDFLSSTSVCRFIRMSNVLEHFTEPRKQLTEVLSKLDLGGVILVEGPLEINFSLVNLFKWNYQRLRKWLNSDYVTHDPPYHVFYSNYSNQRDLFISMGLEELIFIAREDAWPFSDQFRQIKSVSSLFKFMVAKCSKLICLFMPRSGNTFLFVGRKR